LDLSDARTPFARSVGTAEAVSITKITHPAWVSRRVKKSEGHRFYTTVRSWVQCVPEQGQSASAPEHLSKPNPTTVTIDRSQEIHLSCSDTGGAGGVRTSKLSRPPKTSSPSSWQNARGATGGILNSSDLSKCGNRRDGCRHLHWKRNQCREQRSMFACRLMQRSISEEQPSEGLQHRALLCCWCFTGDL
jgi:hypothetical protein